jgi:hypothetical protein
MQSIMLGYKQTNIQSLAKLLVPQFYCDELHNSLENVIDSQHLEFLSQIFDNS